MRGFLVEYPSLGESRFAEQHDETVRLLDAGDRGIGQKLAGEREAPDRFLPARAVCEAGEHCADLADDLGVIRAERDVEMGSI